MSETRDQLVEQLDCYSGTMMDIDSDIIDISAINLSNHDTWLQPSRPNPSEYNVHDLHAWLRADNEQDYNNLQDNRRSIDTRTFTRPKKRSGRLSFESIVEGPSSSNVWKPQASRSFELQTNMEDVEPLSQRRESTPPMLRPSNPEVSGLCSADSTLNSGQESLEAFLNMSQSKGIDSFINLGEPEFSDGVMNVSQPSLLYSSMMSTTRDDLSQTLNQSQIINQSQMINQSSIEDSQILTESMMQSSMFGDVTDVHFNDTFAKNNGDVTVLENTSFCSSDDKTFVAASVSHLKEPLNGTFNTAAFNNSNMLSVDATYTPTKWNATLTHDFPNDPHASYIVNHKCQSSDIKTTVNDTSYVMRKETVNETSYIVRKDTISDASFVVRKDPVNDSSFVVRKDTVSVSRDAANDASFVVRPKKMDASFVITTDHNIAEDATYKLNIPQPSDQNDTFNVQNFDATFEKTPSSSPRKFSTDTTTRPPRASSDKLSMKFNAPKAVDHADDFENLEDAIERTPSSSPRKFSTDTTTRPPRTLSDKFSMKLNVPKAVDHADDFEYLEDAIERTPSSSPRKFSTDTTTRPPRTLSDKFSMKLNVPKAVDHADTDNFENFEGAIEKTPSSSPRKFTSDTISRPVRALSDKFSMKLNAPKPVDHDDNFENFDATFEKTPSSSPRKSSTNSTFKAPTPASDTPSETNDHAINSTFKAPTQAKKMDMTYEHNTENNCKDVPLTNRYNTYRKAPSQERPRNENYATNNLTTKCSNETVNIGASLENLDATFNKPVLKIPRKLNAPRALSRLPQTLQKSNPNLISNSLKAVNTGGRSAIPSFGFRKIVPPGSTRNVQSSLTSKLYGLGKMKSGSEQRLEVTRNAAEFQIGGTGGSTESIDSTQSAHSAPDFDDRLSVCSDSSHTSYSMRTMNIEDLQKTRIQADYLKPESTPLKPNRRVLENTWVEAAKDLPSPILKNGPETYGSRGSSPRSTNSTVKTSSPLLSPAGSLQNLTIVTEPIKENNADETKLLVPRNEHIVAKKISEAAVKPARSAGENRTGLRPPASWSSANQRPSSGIPRPASRIPAPRMVRPPTKINQGGMKKGCL